MTLISVTSCANTTVVSDYCLRDRLILGVEMTDEVIMHNSRWSCACETPTPEWCVE